MPEDVSYSSPDETQITNRKSGHWGKYRGRYSPAGRKHCFLWTNSWGFERKPNNDNEKPVLVACILSSWVCPLSRSSQNDHISCVCSLRKTVLTSAETITKPGDMPSGNVRRYYTVYLKSMKFIVLMLWATEHPFITSGKYLFQNSFNGPYVHSVISRLLFWHQLAALISEHISKGAFSYAVCSQRV